MSSDMPNTNPDKSDYYQVQSALAKWEDFEKYNGSNYVSECYVSMYRGILDKLSGKQRGGLSKKDKEIVKNMGADEEGFNEHLLSRIKQLKRLKLRGKATWIDDMLYDVYVDLYRERRGK